MIGPGVYDDEASAVREGVKAKGVILIVVGGDRGSGFSCQGYEGLVENLPTMLRDVAGQIEADLSTLGDSPP